jgi:hypothetical protein
LILCGLADWFLSDPYGSTESTRRDGTLISGLVTWDSKITTVNALLGGVSDFVRQRMIKDGIYQEFIDIIQVREISKSMFYLCLKPHDCPISILIWLTMLCDIGGI